MARTAFLLALVSTLLLQTHATDVVLQTIKDCNFMDKTNQVDLNNCLFKVLDAMKAEGLKGKTVLGLTNLEPIHLGNFTFVQGEGPVRVKSTFRNFLVHGFSNYTLTKFEVKPETGSLTLGVNIPELFAEGEYTLDGNALLLKIEGDGDMWSKVRNLNGVVSLTIIIRDENGKKRLGVTDVKANFTVESSQTNLSNLFEGDPILDETIHHFINNNNFIILEGLQPVINAEIGAFLEVIIDSVFAEIPIHVIFPNGV